MVVTNVLNIPDILKTDLDPKTVDYIQTTQEMWTDNYGSLKEHIYNIEDDHFSETYMQENNVEVIVVNEINAISEAVVKHDSCYFRLVNY